MKMRTILAVAAVCLLGTLCLAMGSKPKAPADSAAPAQQPTVSEKGWQLVVYYLHGNFRCATCMAIENQSKEAVETVFAGEIRDGKVAYIVLNFDEPGNQHFITDYNLTTKSLVLSLRKDGREVKWKNLPGIWTHIHSAPPAFRDYVSGEVRTMLKEMN